MSFTAPRDTQRTKIFNAEARVLGTFKSETLADLIQFADTVTRSRWWGTRRPDIRKLTMMTTGGNWCGAGWPRTGAPITSDRVEVSVHRRSQLHVLHALAHFLQPPESAWHGHEFAQAYLNLAKRWLPESEPALREAFRFFKVKTTTWSPEAKAAASERAHQRRFTEAGERTRALLAALESDDE